MASAYDDAMAALKQGGLLEKPKADSGGNAPESTDEDTDPWWKRAGKGALKGFVGETAVGPAEVVAGLTGGDVSEIPGEKWVNEPSRSNWERVGNFAGTALPFLWLPEIRAASSLGRIMEWIGKGALAGGAQPTGGDPEQHVGGALAGAIGGGAAGVPGLAANAVTGLAHSISPRAGQALHSMLSNITSGLGTPDELRALARTAAALGGADISSGAIQWPPQLPSRPPVQGTSAPAPSRRVPGGAPSGGDSNNPFGITDEDVADPPM